MATFKYKLKRLRTLASDNIQTEELPLKSKLYEGYLKEHNNKKEPESTITEKSNSNSPKKHINDKYAISKILNLNFLNGHEDFGEIVRLLKLNINPKLFKDDENLLNYCFLISKPFKNNVVGFTFHVAMENIINGRPRILSQSMSTAVEYICCTKFPPKLLHGEDLNTISPFKITSFKEADLINFKDSGLGKSLNAKECELLIVLDMDETLVHCTSEILKNNAKPDLLVNIATYSSPWFVYFRPFLRFFLNCASKLGNICIFTASTKEYAEQVIKFIDPNQTIIKYKLFREHCTIYNKGYMKDLRIIQGANLKKTVLVDNSLISNTLQLDNAIPVDSWYGCNKDNELLRLLILLNRLHYLEDVRPYLASRYGLREWINMNRTKDNLIPI